MATQLEITLDDEQRRRLEELAAGGRETASDVAARAVAEYLAEDAAFRRAVEEGLLAGRAGDVVDFKPFADDLRRKMAIRAIESDR
jgi:predicted transcriptional regulator